ncbi:Serine/Threonine protein kinase [Spraguea lophii 42_110]|uniref:Serine/Threonine protein kinase n=1 Tax=Spraguea lophii (strain 42_110) TaxID=1358809 RepID=S7WDK4_SPRLO|nr:Serine/Threonine protein kinase [Spraguea lophii 42_110]
MTTSLDPKNVESKKKEKINKEIYNITDCNGEIEDKNIILTDLTSCNERDEERVIDDNLLTKLIYGNKPRKEMGDDKKLCQNIHKINPVKFFNIISFVKNFKTRSNVKIDVIQMKCCGLKYVLKACYITKECDDGCAERELKFFRKRDDLDSIHIMERYSAFSVNKKKFYFVDEYIEGEDLLRYIYLYKKMNENEIYALGLVIYKLISELHDYKIKHNDIKPDNFILGEKGTLRIIDFGLSNFLKNKTDKNKMYGFCCRTAPEIILGKPLGMEMDWYNFGTILYTLYTRRAPFKAPKTKDGSEPLIYPRNPSYNGRYPVLEDLIQKLLHKDIDKRLCGKKVDGKDILLHPFFQDEKKSFILRSLYPKK